jgi:hypothetical protein
MAYTSVRVKVPDLKTSYSNYSQPAVKQANLNMIKSINQNYGSIISKYEQKKKDKNEMAEPRCDTIFIAYVRDPSDILRRQLARKHANLIFKKGTTL